MILASRSQPLMPRSTPRDPQRPSFAPSTTKPRGASHKVRIIGGLWKRSPLTVIDGPGVRPTPDRVRETLFNWLTHQFAGSLNGLSVLDAYAGTGALGFEAASRGAAQVVLIENNAAAVRNLHAARDKLKATGVEIRQADAVAALGFLAARGPAFDIVFLDPPYGAGGLQRCLPLAAKLLKPDGCIYAESEAYLPELLSDCPALLEPYELLRADKAGQVFYHLLRRKI
jgi:16S rRNA (guanine966-N2)-methyltransferase